MFVSNCHAIFVANLFTSPVQSASRCEGSVYIGPVLVVYKSHLSYCYLLSYLVPAAAGQFFSTCL